MQNQETLYEIQAKRDLKMMKSFITFLHRVQHPRVTYNFLFFGILILFLPFTSKNNHPIVYGLCYGLGAFMILMGLFRQYIPLLRMRKRDEDYIQGIVYTYRFDARHINVYRGDELLIRAGKYQQVTSFFHDEYYFYLGMNDDDLFILPKNRFTVGNALAFSTFLQEKTGQTPRFVPARIDHKIQRFFSRFIIGFKVMNAEAERKQQEMYEQQRSKKRN